MPRKEKSHGILGSIWSILRGAYKGTRNFIILRRVRGKTIILTDHAKERMQQRHISIEEIKQALRKGTLNDRKSEPKEKPWPKYVIDAKVKNKNPQNKNSRIKEVEIVLSPNNEETVIITVIDKDTDWPVDESSHR